MLEIIYIKGVIYLEQIKEVYKRWFNRGKGRQKLYNYIINLKIKEVIKMCYFIEEEYYIF